MNFKSYLKKQDLFDIMAEDIFDNIIIQDKFELLNNIEYPTYHDNDPIIDNYQNKFDENKLFININQQFAIIQKSSNKSPKKKHSQIILDKKQKNNDNILAKKRGRPAAKNGKKCRRNSHDRKCPCNIRTKITNAYISFLIQFINSVIELLFRDEVNINQFKMKKLIYTNNITIDFIKNLKLKSIKDIITDNVGTCHLSDKNNENIKICKTIIEKNKELEKVLNQNYMEFFEYIFHQSQKEVDLNKYGINKIVFLNSDVVLFKDFINNIKNKEKKGGDDLEKYLKKIEKVVENYLKI